jgi:hypothetical protein
MTGIKILVVLDYHMEYALQYNRESRWIQDQN